MYKKKVSVPDVGYAYWNLGYAAFKQNKKKKKIKKSSSIIEALPVPNVGGLG